MNYGDDSFWLLIVTKTSPGFVITWSKFFVQNPWSICFLFGVFERLNFLTNQCLIMVWMKVLVGSILIFFFALKLLKFSWVKLLQKLILLNCVMGCVQVGCKLYMKTSNTDWLSTLLRSEFFGSCFHHQEFRKNEKNLFCIDCNVGLCRHCMTAHCLHRRLQICKYVYHDVVRLQEMQKHLDCSKIQVCFYSLSSIMELLLSPNLMWLLHYWLRFDGICNKYPLTIFKICIHLVVCNHGFLVVFWSQNQS